MAIDDSFYDLGYNYQPNKLNGRAIGVDKVEGCGQSWTVAFKTFAAGEVINEVSVVAELTLLAGSPQAIDGLGEKASHYSAVYDASGEAAEDESLERTFVLGWLIDIEE